MGVAFWLAARFLRSIRARFDFSDRAFWLILILLYAASGLCQVLPWITSGDATATGPSGMVWSVISIYRAAVATVLLTGGARALRFATRYFDISKSRRRPVIVRSALNDASGSLRLGSIDDTSQLGSLPMILTRSILTRAVASQPAVLRRASSTICSNCV